MSDPKNTAGLIMTNYVCHQEIITDSISNA